jgi:probable rRNA maturation factor
VRGRARRKVTQELLRELKRFLRRVIIAAGEEKRALTVSLVDDDEILALNRQYADEDHATDVLSFSQAERRDDAPRIKGERAKVLGDVVISVETAARQAKEQYRALVDELVHLAIHGVAHLQGFDHATPDEQQVMWEYAARLRSVAYDYKRPAKVSRKKLSWPPPRRA